MRMRAVLIAAAVVVALTAGWPTLEALLPDTGAAPAGTPLRIGPEDDDSARFTLGPGWSVVRAETSPDRSWMLSREGVVMDVAYLTPARGTTPAALWNGLRDVTRVQDPDAALSAPAPATTRQGVRGQTGRLRQNGETGTLTVFRSPRGGFAVLTTVLGGVDATAAARAAAERATASIAFPGRGR
ncbi:hypothetical protein [Actinomadura parmotrematis]|uniref:DUF4245 domain-containing protein n=1 Tax=Actinomadura parmotrematis TaxID=2864039 RepID=A0ABS7FQK2_9ACTN|nr:hypothetical protein [Actinomadura parmotrematis]MBW8482591.1 hypothetical protein [Actinomadura parmotrematis]